MRNWMQTNYELDVAVCHNGALTPGHIVTVPEFSGSTQLTCQKIILKSATYARAMLYSTELGGINIEVDTLNVSFRNTKCGSGGGVFKILLHHEISIFFYSRS